MHGPLWVGKSLRSTNRPVSERGGVCTVIDKRRGYACISALLRVSEREYQQVVQELTTVAFKSNVPVL